MNNKKVKRNITVERVRQKVNKRRKYSDEEIQLALDWLYMIAELHFLEYKQKLLDKKTKVEKNNLKDENVL